MSKTVQVTLEDQQNINSFSKLNSRLKELEAEVNARKKLLEDLEDAGNELLLSDDDMVSLVIAECFVSLEKDEAEQKLDEMTSRVNEEMKLCQGEMDGIRTEMTRLKGALYSRLGNSINLEE